MANIKLTLPAAPFTGQIVTFPAPCGCDEVTGGLSINGEIYTVVDAMGKCITGKGGAWCEGAQVSVALDCESKKAYIQNANTNAYLEGELAKKYSPTNKPTLTDIGAAPAWELIYDIVVNKNKYGDGAVIFPKGFDASPYEYIMLDTDITFSVTPLQHQEVDTNHSVSLYRGLGHVYELCSTLSDTLDVTATDIYKAKKSYSVNSSHLHGNNNGEQLLMWSNYVTSDDTVMVIGAPVSNPTESASARYSLTGTVKIYGKKWGI